MSDTNKTSRASSTTNNKPGRSYKIRTTNEPRVVVKLAVGAPNTNRVDSSTRMTEKRKPGWCLFEDHFFDAETKLWVQFNSQDGLRPCRHSKCKRSHKLKNRATEVCSRENDCPDAGITCFLLHDNTRIKPMCRYGEKCCDEECTEYRHPSSRTTEPCPERENCKEALITCFKLHPLSRTSPLCRYKSGCLNYICENRHPPDRREICDDGSMCYNFITKGEEGCKNLHPKILQKICRWDNNGCRSYGCPYVHNPGSPADCESGLQCQNRLENSENRCSKKHPKYTKMTRLEDGTLHFE